MQDATVQSTPPTSQAPAAVAPNSYVAAAPAAAPQAVQQAPVPYQVGTTYPQAVPTAVPSYQSSPTQYAPQSQPAPQANPWESAFNKVVGVLSSPVQSPFQAAPSPQTTPYTQANYGQPNVQATPNSVPQTWQANQTYSPNYSQDSSNLYGQEARQANQEVDGAIADYYNLSQETRQVLSAFGQEAPAILNQYAVNLEGLLDGAVQWGSKVGDLMKGYANFAVNEHKENLAYNEILTNPDTLSDYTLRFFGPEGPHPVYENQQQLETKGYPTQVPNAAPNQMPAPPTAAAAQQPENFWGNFNEQMARDPQNAWRVLNQAAPQSVQNKLFVME